MSLPLPDYEHLLALIDDTGIYEHTRHGVPRREHGYCVDDAARAIVVLCAAPELPSRVRALRTLLAFVLHSLTPEGRFRNRLSFDRTWEDDGRDAPDDTQGRGIWALGVAATTAPRADLRAAAASALGDVPDLESPHLRALSYAALGASALWTANPDDPDAARFAAPAVRRLVGAPRPWPEARLTYANARVPAAMIAAGEVAGMTGLVDSGLEVLAWLIETETRDDHFSFTPVGGRSPGEHRPLFDQQPIEAAAMADAAERAWRSTGDRRWHDAVQRAGFWLLGQNDTGTPLYDPDTGSTRDGLMRDHANANSGAESTIAGLMVLQACHRLESGPGAHRRTADQARARN